MSVEKVCLDCGELKRHEAKGLCSACYMRRKRVANPEKFKAYDKAYHAKRKALGIKVKVVLCKSCGNKGEHRGFGLCSACWQRDYKAKTGKFGNDYHQEWRDANREKFKAYYKKYYANNHERVLKNKRKTNNARYARLKNDDDFKAKTRQYKKNSIESRRAWTAEWRKKPQNKLRKNISNQMRKALIGNKSGRSWESIVGYTQEDLRNHLETQFDNNMSWENYGEWHIDHCIPVSHFNFKSAESEEFKKCFSLKNLKPMWAYDNISKGNRFAEPLIEVCNNVQKT